MTIKELKELISQYPEDAIFLTHKYSSSGISTPDISDFDYGPDIETGENALTVTIW